MSPVNEHGQPVGPDLAAWVSPEYPPTVPLKGRTVVVEPLDWSAHGEDLYVALAGAPETLWTYMSFGPLDGIEDLERTVTQMIDDPDWSPFVFVVDGTPLGFASYLRINPGDGVIEIGSITLGPTIQRTTAATEALYLMIKNVFDLGYRRCEWKCDDLNASSRSAALRLGFAYEGTFRQATHYKGRNRDTAWYAIVDTYWPRLDEAFRTWLSPRNFADDGSQITHLSQLTADIGQSTDY